MSMRSLMGGLLRWFREYEPGTLFYLDANREETALPIPADWAAKEAAGTPYRLGIIAAFPAWVEAAASVDPIEAFLDLDGNAFYDLSGNIFTTLPG